MSVTGFNGALSADIESAQSGATTFNINQNTLNGQHTIYVEIKGGANAKITVNHDTTGDVSVSGGHGYGYGSMAGGTGTDAYAEVYFAPGTDSDTGSKASTIIESGTCSPSQSYKSIGVTTATGGTRATGYFDGTVEGTSSLDVTVEVGSSEPVAVIDGPKVSGVVDLNPDPGAYVTFESDSYDPDDTYPGQPTVYRICSYVWTLTDPDGIQTGGTSSSYSTTLTKTGPYSITLTVTDNEGIQDSDTVDFIVGGERASNSPHDTNDGYQCSAGNNKKDVFVFTNAYSGDGGFYVIDPIRTRGYPLKNDIRVRNRRAPVQTVDWMGNAYFTYGTQVVVDSGDRFLVDGHGNVMEYGTGSSSLTPGVYPTLSDHTGGYTLSDAGPPNRIHIAGNYTYEFDTAGKLTSITDP
ncbi:MAG: hypothetical protein J5J00_01450, partial [Deltaproteobacteria bacterium]|nr:hypothetical protein [Deltaproteobacteria bacterium]